MEASCPAATATAASAAAASHFQTVSLRQKITIIFNDMPLNLNIDVYSTFKPNILKTIPNVCQRKFSTLIKSFSPRI